MSKTAACHLEKIILAALALTAFCGCDTACSKPTAAFKAAEAIVVTNDATAKTKQGASWYKAALTDLTNALTCVTGAKVAVYVEGKEPKDAKAVIYLGETAAAKAAGLTGEGLRNGDWRVKTVPGKAFLFGTTGMAASYAMTDFCERLLDCHWYTPYVGPTYVRNSDLAVPCVDLVRKPVIYQRSIYHAMYDGNRFPNIKPKWENWCRRRQGEWTDEIEGEYRLCHGPGPCHTIHNYLPPEKHFKDHPEWFSMGPDGKRRGVRNAQSQICYSNPEVRDVVYKALVGFVEKEYKARPDNPSLIFDMTQMDNSDFLCLCPECKKVIAKYNRVEGGHKEGGDAGLQLEFANDLARRIRVKYPKVQLRVFAYVSTECAPKPGTIAVEPNVMIWWCDVYGYSCHLYPLRTPGHFNAHQAEEIGEWLKLTKNIQVWDYFLSGPPEVIPDAAAEDAKLFTELGLPSMFMESEYYEQPFHFLNHYLLSVLYADPSQDVEKLIHGFCRVYGKGAADMEAAVKFLRTIQNETKVGDKQDWHLRNLAWVTPANYEKLAAYCRAAYDKESDPNVRALIVMVLKKTWNALVGMYKKDPSAAAKFADAQEQYRRFGKEWAQYGFIEEKVREKRAAEVDDDIDVLTLRFDDLPADLRDAPAKDVLCLDYHSFDSWSRNFKDEKAFRQRALCVPPDQKFGKGFPFSCGVYDSGSKENFGFKVNATDLPADGSYHWVHMGRIYLGRHSRIWFPGSWCCGLPLSQNHIYADGLPVDPNWYDMWISWCVNGPAFIPGSTEKNTIRLDRVALRRIAPPAEKK